MRKSVTYAFLGFAATAGILVVVLIASRKSGCQSDETLTAYEEGKEHAGLTMLYPLDETLFPPQIVPPTFSWEDSRHDSD